MTTETQASTKQLLMDAGVRLIAERGFADVTVGDIEATAGFAPRGGTLYKHFASKKDLLDAVMAHHVDTLAEQTGLDGFTELPDLRSELIVLANWILRRMTAEETISTVIEKEGHRYPELVAQMRDGVSEPGYALMAAYLTERGLHADLDAKALSVLLVGGLVNLRRSAWTFGAAPGGVSDKRAAAAWAELAMALFERPGEEQT